MRYLITGIAILLTLQACNKNCSEVNSDISGGIVKTYDFGNCLIYAQLDSHRVISTDTGWITYKTKYLGNCNPAGLENIDFSQNMLVGYKVTEFGCNLGMHRKLIVDETAKTYTYQVRVEVCGGCNSRLSSPNWVLMPQLPPGYTMRFETVRE